MGDAVYHIIAVRDVHRLLSTTGASMLASHWIIVVGVVLVLRYILAVVKYNIARRSHRKGQLPPRYPAPVPLLGNAISLAWDLGGFSSRATCFHGKLTSTRIPLLWASNFNAVSAATLASYHVFRDPSLLARLRAELAAHFDPPSTFESADPKLLLKLPLLSAVYAEILRLYVKVFFMASSPHEDVNLGSWYLPRGTTGVVSSGISHMDASYWNDAGGKHPLNEFWPDRFLVDPVDPSSGPVRPDKIRSIRCSGELAEPCFSTEGLEGVWIPYGGGPSICPGRCLAKNVVFFFCSFLITHFDIEPLNDDCFQLDPWRYGLGTTRTKYPVPVRIRRRT